ncbi:MAG: glycosyltransferase [Terracidiphilus sp.]
MKISVIVTTYNRKASLTLCLTSLAAQRFPTEEYEVIVVADGCTDGSVELLRSFVFPCAFTWFAQSNQGQPAAQNFGVAAARGDIVLFMDDDCICDPELVSAHYEAHARGSHLVVLGAVLLHPDSPPGTLRKMVKELEDAEYLRLSTEGTRRSDLMLCANSSIARQAAVDCPFDTSYKRIHDVEAGVRLWSKGYRPLFAPKAVAYELYTKTASGLLRDSKYLGKYEVILSTGQPGFKPLAGIVHMNVGGVLRRSLRKQLALHPLASEFVLRPLNSLAESLRFLPPFGWLAKSVLSARAVISHLSGAILEAGSWEKLEERFGKRIPVIMLHNVGSARPGEYPGLTTPTAEFEGQIRLLSEMGYQGIRPSQWLQWRDAGGTLPRRPVMLVFDDAYAEACSNAFPILERYSFGAACMVVTQCIGATNRWDEEAGRPSFQLMGKSEILEWSQKSIEFGGHTGSHPDLTTVSDERAEQEIAQCKADLTALLGEDPVSFAYPFGGVSHAAQAAARNHFQIAFTAWPGRLHLGTNPYLVPRIAFLPGESRIGMWCRLRIGRNPFEVFRNRLVPFFRKARRGGQFEGSSIG